MNRRPSSAPWTGRVQTIAVGMTILGALLAGAGQFAFLLISDGQMTVRPGDPPDLARRIALASGFYRLMFPGGLLLVVLGAALLLSVDFVNWLREEEDA